MTIAAMLALENPEVLMDQITEGTWGTFTTYRCPACAFDSTDAEVTRQHVCGHINFINSSRPAVPPAPGVGLFDANGKVIE